MRKSVLIRTIILVSLLAAILIACRRDEEATPVPDSPTIPAKTTAVEVEQVEPTPTKEIVPTATPKPAAAIAPEDIDWSPQVIASNPAPGEEITLDSPIVFRFDQPMDQDSVEAAWAVEPAVNGRFQWPRTDTVVFTPSEELKRAQSYLVRINDNASSQNGLTLEEAIELNLETIGNLKVNQVIPADGTQDVQGDAAITVVFNRPVVPLVSSDQQAELPQPLTINPPVEGEGSWVSTSIYRFEPGLEGLAGATTYQVTVDQGLTDVTGAVLPSSFSWQFTTQNPSVVQILPADGASLVPPSRPISVTFSMPMDRPSTEAAVSFNPGAPVSYEWHEDDRLLVITPQEQLQLETTYELVVDQTATSASGQAGLDRGVPTISQHSLFLA